MPANPAYRKGGSLVNGGTSKIYKHMDGDVRDGWPRHHPDARLCNAPGKTKL